MTLLLQKIELSVSVWSECECHFLEADLFFSLKPEWWTIGLFKATEAVEGKAVCDTERFINDEEDIGLFFFYGLHILELWNHEYNHELWVLLAVCLW